MRLQILSILETSLPYKSLIFILRVYNTSLLFQSGLGANKRAKYQGRSGVANYVLNKKIPILCFNTQ